MNHVLLVVHYMRGFAPLGLGVLCLLKMAGPARHSPPPNGGPGGDMGTRKVFTGALHQIFHPNESDDERRRRESGGL